MAPMVKREGVEPTPLPEITPERQAATSTKATELGRYCIITFMQSFTGLFAFFPVEAMTKDESSTALPTISTSKEIEKKMEQITEKLAEEMGIPTWGVVSIIIGTLFSLVVR